MGRPVSKAIDVPCAAHKVAAGAACSVNEQGRRYYCPPRRAAAALPAYARGPSGPSGKRPPKEPGARWTSRRARATIAAYLVDALDPDQMERFQALEQTDPVFAAAVAAVRTLIAREESTDDHL